MTFDLTPEQVPNFRPLPGHCLIKTSPPQYMTDSGLIHIPKGIAHNHQEGEVVRKGELIDVNRFGKGNTKTISHLGDAHFWDGEADALFPGQTVYYWGHLNEADNAYVIAKIGQLVAFEPACDDEYRAHHPERRVIHE